MANIQATLTHRERRIRPLFVEPEGSLWAAKRNRLLRMPADGKTFQNIASYSPRGRERLSRFRLLERLFRLEFRSAVVNSNGVFVGCVHDRILRLAPGDGVLEPVFRIEERRKPFHMCRDRDDRIFWGEYFDNPERKETRIHVSEDDGLHWEIAHVFPAGEIRHIHNVQFDPFRGGFWILTGDNDSECRIIFANREFNQIETVFGGKQQFRTLELIIKKDYLICGTDAPHEQNCLLRLDPESGAVECLQEIPGPVFHLKQVGDYMVASVAMEKSKVNTDRHAYILASLDGETWNSVYSREKDPWHGKYMHHGLFVFPEGEFLTNRLHAYGQAIKQDDGCWLSLELGAT